MEKSTNQYLTGKVNNLIARIELCEKRRIAAQKMLAELGKYAKHLRTCQFPKEKNPSADTLTCNCGLIDLLERCAKL